MGDQITTLVLVQGYVMMRYSIMMMVDINQIPRNYRISAGKQTPTACFFR